MTEEERREAEFDAQMEELMRPDSPGGEKKIHKKWSKKRKIAGAAAAAVAILGIFRACSGGNGTIPVATTPLTKGDLTEKMALTGPISGTDSVDVFSNLHWEVEALYVKEGDRVRRAVEELLQEWSRICYQGFTPEERQAWDAFLTRITENVLQFKREEHDG